MGDAVLAFFRSEADPATNCSAAFDAALRGLARLDAVALREPELRAGISLHHGTVSYGNIGAGSRLDFTIIGRDVNLVSRIQTVCSVVVPAVADIGSLRLPACSHRRAVDRTLSA